MAGAFAFWFVPCHRLDGCTAGLLTKLAGCQIKRTLLTLLSYAPADQIARPWPRHSHRSEIHQNRTNPENNTSIE